MTTMRQLRCLAGVLGLVLLGSGTRLQAQNEGFEDSTKQPLKIAQRLAVPRQPAGRPCAPSYPCEGQRAIKSYVCKMASISEPPSKTKLLIAG